MTLKGTRWDDAKVKEQDGMIAEVRHDRKVSQPT